LQVFPQNRRIHRVQVDVVAAGARVAGFDDMAVRPVHDVIVVGRNRGVDGVQDVPGGGPFDGERRLLIARVFQPDIVGDDELIKMLHHGLALCRLDIEKQEMLQGENRNVG
jgi:hypothetical protein